MLTILTSKQIGLADKFTIKHEPISSINLMERYASCSYKIIRELLKSHQHICKIHIFCGVGNNGSDGLAIARMFINDGFTPEIYKVCFSHKTSDEFQINTIRLTELNANINIIETENNFPGISKDDFKSIIYRLTYTDVVHRDRAYEVDDPDYGIKAIYDALKSVGGEEGREEVLASAQREGNCWFYVFIALFRIKSGLPDQISREVELSFKINIFEEAINKVSQIGFINLTSKKESGFPLLPFVNCSM